MASAAFYVNGTVPTAPRLLTAGTTCTLSLADTAGVTSVAYSFIGASEAVTYPTLTTTALGAVTFTVPTAPSHGYGLTLLAQCVVNGSSATADLCVGTIEQIATNETTERGAVGWMPQLNANARSAQVLINGSPVTVLATDHSLAASVASGLATIAAGKHHLVHTYATGGTGTSADPWTGWDAACPWASGKAFIFTTGYFRHSATLALDELRNIYFSGMGDGTVLLYTGSGTAVSCQRRADDIINYMHHPMYNYFGNFRIDGGGLCLLGLDIRGLFFSSVENVRFRNVLGTCMALRFCVVNEFRNIACQSSVLDPLCTVNPAIGIHLQTQAVGGFNVENTVCTFTCCDFFGPTEKALWIETGFGNVFNGGAFESGTGTNLVMGSTADSNQFHGVDFEICPEPCYVDGRNNEFHGCISPAASITLGPNSIRNRFTGGNWSQLLDCGRDNEYDVGLFSGGNVDPLTTAANTFSQQLGATTTSSASASLSENGGGLALRVPYNTLYRVKVDLSAFCTGGSSGNIGTNWTKKWDRIYKSVGGVISLVTDNSPAGTAAPSTWSAALDPSGIPDSRAIVIGVAGATGDTVRWEADIEVTQNGGTGEVTDVDRVKAIVSAHGGFWARAVNATMPGGVMTIADVNNTVNLVAPSAGLSPALGTLADGETTAIVCDGDQLLKPSATMGTAVSHTLFFVGEPASIDGNRALLYEGSGTPTVAYWACWGGGGPIVQYQELYSTQITNTTALQSLEVSLSATADTTIVYRNGTSVNSGQYLRDVAIGDYTQVGFLGIPGSPGAGPTGKYTDIIYIQGVLTAAERAVIHRCLRNLTPGLP